MTQLTARTYRELYGMMVRIRLCEEALVGPIISGEVRCPVHLYTGEEAIAAGVCLALEKRDFVFGNHRSHGHYLAKGGSMREMVAEIFCKASGCSKGRGGSMHICSPANGMLGSAPIVAGTVALAVGSALASSLRREKRVTVSFFGDGATGEGVIYESMNFAALKKLPVIFACENNFYSTHLPLRECRPSDNIVSTGVPFDISCFRVDGNDACAVFQAARKAVHACRHGKGPVFMEFRTYRMRGHVGPNDNIQGVHTDIRPKEEVARWRGKDPIARMRRVLLNNGFFTPGGLDRIDEAARREVDDAFNFARTSPSPGPSGLSDYVYAK